MCTDSSNASNRNVNDVKGINASLTLKTKEVMREANTKTMSGIDWNHRIV